MKLINPRGRIIEIPEDEMKRIPLLLKQGFIQAPKDQMTEYSQVFDRGDNETQRRPPVSPEMMRVNKMSDSLKVEVI